MEHERSALKGPFNWPLPVLDGSIPNATPQAVMMNEPYRLERNAIENPGLWPGL
jgi:hypothetical protein